MSDPKQEKREVKLPENIPTDYSFERMLKSFMRQVEKDNIIGEVRDRRYYVKPSTIRHKIEGSIARKRKLARRRKK
jgi:ribosomal protein S21